jgi:hypothetical protein
MIIQQIADGFFTTIGVIMACLALFWLHEQIEKRR